MRNMRDEWDDIVTGRWEFMCMVADPVLKQRHEEEAEEEAKRREKDAEEDAGEDAKPVANVENFLVRST